jgi:hypothetical protein
MKTLKLTALSLLLGANIASALPCDGFKINVKNNLADNLVVTTVKLHHGDLTPDGIQKIDKRSEQPFVVNNSPEAASMKGEFSFHTLSIPSRNVKIKFELANKGPICQYTEISNEGDYAVNVNRFPGQVDFNIDNK